MRAPWSRGRRPHAIKLWVDDERPAPPGWTHARSAEEAQAILATSDVEEASFDHDLGSCEQCVAQATGDAGAVTCQHVPTGYDLCLWLVETGRWPKLPLRVHSRNLVGAAQMLGLIARHWRQPGERTAGPSQPQRTSPSGAAAAATAKPAEHAGDRWNTRSRSQPARVLIIDDHYDGRQYLAILLRKAGYTVVTAANGAEALAEMRTERPSVIVLDLMMPAVNGVEFRQRQQADARPQRTAGVASGFSRTWIRAPPPRFALWRASPRSCVSKMPSRVKHS